MRWGWVLLLAGLIAAALLLAWADSTVFQPAFPRPPEPARRGGFRTPVPIFVPSPLGGRPFTGLGRVGGLYTFWWFLSIGAALVLVTLAALLSMPVRVRRAAERVSSRSLPFAMAAGVAAVLLGLATTELLRTTFVLLSFLPVLWAVGGVGIVFGEAALVLAAGRWLRARLGPAPPLVAALAGVLVLIDAGLVPVAGWLFLAVIAVISLGLAVLTRVGSPTGWSLEELNW